MFRKSLPHMGSFDSGITCRNNSGQYLTHLLETSNTGQVSDFVNQIPIEIGRCQVKEKKTKQGIAYLDWEMCYKEDVYVQKKDYVDEVQFIFFMNKGMEWQIGASDHSVCFKKGELCICRDCFQKSAACYEGGYNFLFKSVQIPSKLFFQMIEENFDLLDSSRINQMLKTVMKTGITPYMYRLLREIEDLDFYQGGIASLYLESKISESLNLVWLVILPCLLGFYILAPTIMSLAYRGLTSEMLNTCVSLLRVSSVQMIFIALLQITASILQASGKLKFLIFNLVISAIIKIALTAILVSNFAFNIYGLSISNIIFYLLSSSANLIYLLKLYKLKINFKKLILPLVFIAIMFFPCLIVQSLNINIIFKLLILALIGTVIYIIPVIYFKLFDIKKLKNLKRQVKK